MSDLAHAKNLRRGRCSIPGQVYSVTTVTVEREPVFRDLYLGRILVRVMRAAHERGEVVSLAFVVMPDHLHWLFELGEGEGLPALMKRVKSESAFRINLCRGASGAFWQKGYYDHALRRDEDVQGVARYIVTNPLRAGLVERIGDYSLWDAVWL